MTRGQPAAAAPTVIIWYSAGTSLIHGRLGKDRACRGSCGDSFGCDPEDSALTLAATAPKAARMAATKTAALTTACHLRQAPHRRPGLFDGVSISNERRQDQQHRRESGARAVFLYWRRDLQFSNCLQRPPVQGKKACTRQYSTPLHTAKIPMQYRNEIRILEPGAPLHSHRIDKNCVHDVQRRLSTPAYGTDTYVSATCPTPRRTPLGARGRAGVRRRIGNEYNHMLFNVYMVTLRVALYPISSSFSDLA